MHFILSLYTWWQVRYTCLYDSVSIWRCFDKIVFWKTTTATKIFLWISEALWCSLLQTFYVESVGTFLARRQSTRRRLLQGAPRPRAFRAPRRKAACNNHSDAHPLIKLLFKLFLSRWSSKCCRNCRGFELERLECLLRASIALSCEAVILTCQASSCLDGKFWRSIRVLPLSHGGRGARTELTHIAY